MRKSFVLSAVLLFLFVFANPALGFKNQVLNEVLGVSTASALPELDPTSEGPGLILPDSPLFFLDQLKQNVRLVLALGPEEKARIRAQIAGERLAELRFMLAKNNKRAARVALLGVSDNLKDAATNLSKAQFEGKNVKKLARELNDNIKLKQKLLDSLEQKAQGSLALEVALAQESIFESKIEVEDSMPEEDIENEIKEDLARRIERKVNQASKSAVLVRRDIEVLNKEASLSAAKVLKRREEILRNAIEKRDENLKKTSQRLLENEKKRQEKLLEAQKKAAEEAQDALIRAQKAAIGLERARKVIVELRDEEGSGSAR